MKSPAAHIILSLACACILISGCDSRRKVIPPGVLSDIYFDMFLAEQWINDDYNLRRAADTTLVYEPIFNRYGYTTADYDNSVTYYLARPETFTKIAEATAKRFADELESLERLQKENREADEANRIYRHYHKKDFNADSVRWSFGMMKGKIDSILTEHKWIISQENTDTLQTNPSIQQ